MGGPKALLEQSGLSLLALHVERALSFGASRVGVIVTPEVSARVAPALLTRFSQLELLGARTADPSSSLALLLRQLTGTAQLTSEQTFLITPVDVLPCSEATYRALQRALAPATLAATPTFRGRGGHPVLARGSLLAPYLEGSHDTRPILRELLRASGPRRQRVEVPDATILSDLDTREQAEMHGLRFPSDPSR